MNARPSILFAGLAVLALWVYSRTQQGQGVMTSVVDSVASGIIGFQLNNPLNVERGEKWEGLADEQTHARFANFISMPYGIRAWHKIMQTYRARYGIGTVRGIINRFNPVSDGQPASYIPAVSEYMGISADQDLNVMNRAQAFALCRGMMRVEIGRPAAALVSDAQINEGLTLAGVA